MTNSLGRRIAEHREGRGSQFVRRYGVERLVWAEAYDHVTEAIAAEKRMKRWRRAWKIKLIETSNPEWNDLASEVH